MEELLVRTLGEKIKLAVDLAPGLGQALTDASQLENAILNLAINARDAMPHGGTLTIATTNEAIKVKQRFGPEEIDAGDYTVVCVGDTGVGMSPDTVAKVFEPFFTTKQLARERGLGLSMIYGFAKQSRGHVRVDSAEGQGTAFRLYLPRYQGTPRRGPLSRETTRRRDPERPCCLWKTIQRCVSSFRICCATSATPASRRATARARCPC